MVQSEEISYGHLAGRGSIYGGYQVGEKGSEMVYPGTRVQTETESGPVSGTVIATSLTRVSAWGEPSALVHWDGAEDGQAAWVPETALERT